MTFDTFPQHLLIIRFETLGLPTLVVLLVMIHYESIIGMVHMSVGVSKRILITTGVKQGCLLSLTHLELYIDKLKAVISCVLGATNGCFLFGVSIAILLFADDIILMSHLVKGL